MLRVAMNKRTEVFGVCALDFECVYGGYTIYLKCVLYHRRGAAPLKSACACVT